MPRRRKDVTPTKLSEIDLCNGEFAELCKIVDFLEFMRQRGEPIPGNHDALESLLTRYVLQVRNENLDRLYHDGKITGATVAILRRKYK